VGSLIFRPVESGDIEAIAADLCAGERMTLRDRYGESVDIKAKITESILMSATCHTGVLEGQPVCFVGVVPVSLIDGIGNGWFVVTEQLLRRPGHLVRGLARHIRWLHRTYATLMGQIDSRHVGTIRWMRMLGFQVSEPKPARGNVRFCGFERTV
jgi:hypothetical protein